MDLRKLFLDKTDHTGIQFFRYLFVGGIAFAADFGTLAILVELFGMRERELLAAAIAFVVGLTVNYLISTMWIFKKSAISNRAVEFVIFALIGVVGLGINEAIIWLFQEVLSKKMILGPLLHADQYYLAGKIISTAVVFLWNFIARKWILFNKKG